MPPKLTIYRVFHNGCRLVEDPCPKGSNIAVVPLCASGRAENFTASDGRMPLECTDEFSSKYNLFLNELTAFRYIYDNINWALGTEYVGFMSYRMSLPLDPSQLLAKNHIFVYIDKCENNVIGQYASWHGFELMARIFHECGELVVSGPVTWEKIDRYFSGKFVLCKNTFICHRDVFRELMKYLVPLMDWCAAEIERNGMSGSGSLRESDVRRYGFLLERIVGLWLYCQYPEHNVTMLDMTIHDIRPEWSKTVENYIKSH